MNPLQRLHFQNKHTKILIKDRKALNKAIMKKSYLPPFVYIFKIQGPVQKQNFSLIAKNLIERQDIPK